MLIANPIYDSVFKYLMEDLRVARVILQTIIGQGIESLEVTPRERTAQVASLGISVFRLDFSAVVLTAEGGRKNVLIELQKADGGGDIRRFRRYLAENYYAEAPSHLGASALREDPPHPAEPVLPIITIYILENEKALAEAKAREDDERRQKEHALAELARLKEELAKHKLNAPPSPTA